MKILTKEVEKVLNKTKPYDGDASPDAKIILKLFGGSSYTCLVTSAEKDGDDYILYGYVNIGYGYEYGSSSLNEIMNTKFPPFGLRVERDLYLSKDAKISDYVNDSNRI
jgi:hypothetical protein